MHYGNVASDTLVSQNFPQYAGYYSTNTAAIVVEPSTAANIGLTAQVQGNRLSDYVGLGSRRGHVQDPELLVLQWEGLPASSSGVP